MRGCIVLREVHTGLLKVVKDIFNLSEKKDFWAEPNWWQNVSDLHKWKLTDNNKDFSGYAEDLLNDRCVTDRRATHDVSGRQQPWKMFAVINKL